MREYIKVNRIVSEFMNYFEFYKIYQYRMAISVAEDKSETTVIKFKGKKQDLPHAFIEHLDELKAPRQPELEDYYDDLLGMRNDTFNVDIIAASIDYVTLDLTDTDFEIIIERVYH